VKKKLLIVLAVVLTLTLLLPSVTVAYLPDNTLAPMTYYSDSASGRKWCGPCSGTSIGNYYKYRDPALYGKNYAFLPGPSSEMYDALHEYMDTALTGYTSPDNYGPGFVEMALHYGYDNFSYVHYGPESNEGQVDEDFYEDILIPAIDNGWPIALASMRALYGFSGVDAIWTDGTDDWPATVWHWIAIKGYDRWYAGYDHVVICTDSYSHADNLYLDWDQIVAEVGEDWLEAVIIKDEDTDGDGPFVEDFEWGSDGDSLEPSGGEVDWEVSTSGDSRAEIETDLDYVHTGTKSARFYRDSSGPYAWYSLWQPSYIGFWVKKDDTAYAAFRIGDGDNAIFVRINSSEVLQYSYDLWARDIRQLQADTWYLIEFRNIDWDDATYDIYVDGIRRKNDAAMRPWGTYDGLFYIGSWAGSSGTFWIDDIIDLIPEPQENGVVVEKYVKDNAGNWQDADSAPGPYIPNTQNPVKFKFTIHNTGSFALTGVSLTDTDMATFYTNEGCTTPASFPTTLVADETKTYYGKLVWAAGQHYDLATADGTPPVGSDVSDTDRAYYFGSAPGIDVEKYVKDNSAVWQDADSATGPYIPSTQDPVIFKFTIENTGNVALTGVDLTDTDMATLYTDEGCTAEATFPTTLAVDETKTYYSKLAWAAGQHYDLATADGTPPVGSDVSDTDRAYYFGSAPGIDVEKYVKDNSAVWQDADSATGPYISHKQDPVIFKFTIHNTGNIDLTGVDLTDTDMSTFYTDEACTIVASFPTTLAVDETKTYYGKLAWAKKQQDDTATAVGQPPVGSDVSDSDSAYYYGRG